MIAPAPAFRNASNTPGLVKPKCDLSAEMDRHCTSVVRHKNPFLSRSDFEDLGVRETLEASIVRALEIDGWFATTDALNNCVIQIGIRKESDAHYLGFRNSSLAR